MDIKLNKEMRDFTENIFWGLNIRQTISLGVAIAGVIVTYLALDKYLKTEALSYIYILVTSLPAAVGWIKIYGLPFEKFLTNFYYTEFEIPKKLVYKSENQFEIMCEKQSEVDYIESKNTKRIRKK